MVFRKKQMVLSALVLMLGIAGYLNYRYDKDAGRKVALTENIDVDEPQPGETVMVSAPTQKEEKTNNDPFKSDKLRRDAAREKTREELNSLLSSNELPAEQKEEILKKLSDLASFEEQEVTAQNLLSAKGFKHTMVYISSEGVTVTVKRQGISKSDTAKIVDIIFELTQNNNVKIVEVE